MRSRSFGSRITSYRIAIFPLLGHFQSFCTEFDQVFVRFIRGHEEKRRKRWKARSKLSKWQNINGQMTSAKT